MIAALFCVSVSALDVNIKPCRQWKKAAKDEYTLAFDGSATWPNLRITPVKPLKPGTFYRLRITDKISGNAEMFLIFVDKKEEKTVKEISFWRGSDQHMERTFYFRTLDAAGPYLSISVDPGEKADIMIRNIRLEEVHDPGKNLLCCGNFEKGSEFFPMKVSKSKTDIAKVKYVPSQDFISGRTSMSLNKAEGKYAEVSTGNLPVIPGKTIEVRFWVKANVPGKIRAILDFARKKQNKHLYHSIFYKAEKDWKEFSFEYSVPSDADYTALKDGYCRLRLVIPADSAAEEVLFDNVEYLIK